MEQKRQGGREMGDRPVRICVAFILMALSRAIFCAGVDGGGKTTKVTVERNVARRCRDGVTLRADIYRPKAEGKFPVLLVRTAVHKPGRSTSVLEGAACAPAAREIFSPSAGKISARSVTPSRIFAATLRLHRHFVVFRRHQRRRKIARLSAIK